MNLFASFSRRRLEWDEPEEFREILYQLEQRDPKRWRKRLGGFAAGVSVVFTYAIGEKDFDLVHAIVFIACAGFFWMFAVPWIYAKLGSTVKVYDDRIVRSTGFEGQTWQFKKLASFEFGSTRHFSTLLLRDKKGERILIGVAPNIPISPLAAFFEKHGLVAAENEPQSDRLPATPAPALPAAGAAI